jgi:hypothetical protein
MSDVQQPIGWSMRLGFVVSGAFSLASAGLASCSVGDPAETGGGHAGTGVGGAAGSGVATAGTGGSSANAGSGVGTGGTPTQGGGGNGIGGAAGGSAGATGGGSAGATGGGTTGGGAGAAGSAGTCSPGYLLCEDFESAAVGAVPAGWTAHGKAAVGEDQANRGKHSLKITPAENGERRIYHSTAMVGAEHWGRVYYRVQLPTPDAFVHSTLVTFYGKGPTVGDAEFRFVDTVKDQKTGGFANGKHQFLYNVQPNGAEFGMGTNYDYTFEDKWHCAEWHVKAADQSYTFYFEGKDVLHFTHGAGVYKDSELPTTFAEVRLGWNNYQSAPPGFTAWLDDFAIDDVRVGCLP